MTDEPDGLDPHDPMRDDLVRDDLVRGFAALSDSESSDLIEELLGGQHLTQISDPSNSMVAMAGPSAPEVLPERLLSLVDLIANRTIWTPQEHDIALLLLHKNDPQLASVPRRPVANMYLATGPCVFFVDKSMPAHGKKRKSESSSQAAGSSNDEMWIKGTSTSAAGGSLDKNLPPNAGCSAVLRKSGGFTPEAKTLYGPRRIGHYCLGYTEGHPNFDPEDRTRPLLLVGRNKEKFQQCQPDTWLVHCMPTELDSDDAENTGAPDKPDATFGTVSVDELRIKGVDLWGEFEKMKRQCLELVQQLEEKVKRLEDGSSGHTSQRADLAEWMRKLSADEVIRPGDIGQVRGERFTKDITSEPGGIIFVVSSAPALAFNMPEALEERAEGVVLAFIGRVPVFCVGDAPLDSFLVPSGLNDGSARAVSWSQVMSNAPSSRTEPLPLSASHTSFGCTPCVCHAQLESDESLRDRCFGVIWGHLPPDTDGRPMVLAFVCAHPQQTFGRLRNVDQVAPLRSELVPAPLPGRRPLVLRPYQMECLKAGMAENTIVCLDTGLGKTPIAVKLMDHFLAAATEASDGSKVLFIVPTVVLVEQQARVCRQYSANARCVTELCGNRLSGWTQARWDLCIQTSDVLVGTPQIFVDAIITRGYLDLSRFSLVVFDEVHNATGNSPMAALMNDAYWAAKDKGAAVPHILGLTASFVAGAIDDLAGKRQALETLMDSQIFAPEVPVESCGTPTFHTVAYLPDALENYQELVRDKVDVLLSSFEGQPIQVKDHKKIVNHAAHVLVEGGMSAFLFYLGESVAYQLQGIAHTLAELSDENAKACRLKAEKLCKILPELRQRLKEGARGLQEDGQLTSAPFVSAKARRLLELVEDNLKRHDSQTQYKGIVFVEQVALSSPLAYLLNQHFERPDCVGAASGVRADVISGVGTMSSSQRSAVLERFKKGEVRILVATAAIEEGLDVSDCQFVVRYSHFNVPKSHIQGAGRARHQNAEIYYFENSPDAECSKAAEMKLVAQDPSLALCEADRIRLARESLRNIEGFYPFGQGSDGGVVNIYNCVQIFTEYCSKVMGQGLNLRQSKIEVYRTEKVRAFPLEEREYMALVRYPSQDGYQQVTFEDVGAHWGDRAVSDVLMPGRALASTADEERHRFLYTVVVKMRRAGYLTDANQPSPMAIAGTKAAVAAISAADEFNILDRFAPDALDQRFGSSVSISAPGQHALEPDVPEEARAAAAAAAAAERAAQAAVAQAAEAAAEELAAAVEAARAEAAEAQEAAVAAAVERATATAAADKEAVVEAAVVEAAVAAAVGSAVERTAAAAAADKEAGPAPSPPTTENYKGNLMEKAVKLWKKNDGLRFETQVSGQPPTQIFQATVTLLPLGEDCKFTGAQASTKTKAEQAAAAAAMPRMDAEIASGNEARNQAT